MNKLERRINSGFATLVIVCILAIFITSAQQAIATGTDLAVWIVLAVSAVVCGSALVWSLLYNWFAADLWSDLERDTFQEIDDVTVTLSNRQDASDLRAEQIDKRLWDVQRRLGDLEAAQSEETRAVA